MKPFLAAVQFLTILPAGAGSQFEPARMIPFFPVVGLLLGFLVALFDLMAAKLWAAPLTGVLDVVFLILLTGALHLDGLADTADGLYGQRSRDQALSIMKDSRIGAMGAVALFSCLAVKFTAAGSISSDRFIMLLVIPALARGSVFFAVRHLPYGRPQNGTGSAFFQTRPKLMDGWALVLPGGLSLLAGLRGVILLLVFAATVAGVLVYYRRKLGCVTGDMMGAMIEISETGLLLAAALSICV